jgi:hypothetical protein
MSYNAHKLEGQTFERLLVLKRVENRIDKHGQPMSQWLCQCSCGNQLVCTGPSLKSNHTRSCGCFKREKSSALCISRRKYDPNDKDLLIRAQCLRNIRYRSQRRGYETDLDISDIPELTDVCPVLGIRYNKRGNRKQQDSSPTVDRKNPNLPYLKKYKDNLVFISFRANRIKNNATIDDLEKILFYLRDTGSSEKILSN